MRRLRSRYAALILLLLAAVAQADDALITDTILFFDPPAVNGQRLQFDLDDTIRPAPNDFRIIDAVFLSNALGERWALITLENTASGQRFLKPDALLATFADGSQTFAQRVENKLAGGEVATYTVFFGFNPFPMVDVRVD